MSEHVKIAGITSTIPVEIIYAAGRVPVDINNTFITSKDPASLVRRAKMDGFPDTTCSWICGLYGAVLERGIRTVVCVTGGDCAETIALMEVLSLHGIDVIPFSYPRGRDPVSLGAEINRFAERFGIGMERAEEEKKRLDRVRKRIHHLDRLLWEEDRALGGEVQNLQLGSSDFEGNPESYLAKVEEKITEIESRKPLKTTLRLGFVGVPPIISDLYDTIERDGVRVVFSEVQRQFTLPSGGTIGESYTRYTYPYGIFTRAEDIALEVQRRRIDGIIHYVQAFCFRGIEDIALRRELGVPVLTLQGDLPSRVTETVRLRVEAFVDMLHRRRERR
ncbi:MAG TPA: 2-hydroxyacyl-CoA dehydratase family protein [Spirochaetota bacterium]|nr:2-hydroxyacyl-CoA dehydratase family protein [Spirochaetota bacterium]